MLNIEQNRIYNYSNSDSANINYWIDRLHLENGGGDIFLAPKVYLISEPIIMKTGIRLRGQGINATQLHATSELCGPVVISENAQALEINNAWFVSEGVPVRFEVMDLTIDGKEAKSGLGFASGCGMHLYAKGFRLTNIQIINTKADGLVSICSARGGQESWLDEPEAEFNIRISRCGGDGFLMRGPHDSIIRQAIICSCKKRGLAVETNGKYNGACDIEFCHAYGTNDVAIDLDAKVKAGFLQGDTGRYSGVRIRGSNKTYVDRVECFKTRGTKNDFALDIQALFTQIGLARVRADWGAGGVHIGGIGCQISNLDIDGQRSTDGPVNDIPNDTTGLYITAARNRIGSVYVRNFPKGRGIVLKEGVKNVVLSGQTETCAQHLYAKHVEGCDINLNMLLQNKATFVAEPGPNDKFFLRTI